MNWDDKSDYKVNRKLAWLVHSENVAIRKNPKTPSSIFVNGIQGDLDYCNNWADIGPLIEKHQIIVGPCFNIDGDQWKAFNVHTGKVITNNPKRAAAICIIKLLEAKND